MFKIYDGREQFYQWDIDRKLIVEDAAVSQVHFCNRTDDCSLVCETYEEDGATVVNVPNILLQSDWRIRAYAYDGKHTLHEKCFDVIARTKPADYVYTETEILNFETLLSMIADIDENMAAEVEKYLKENPPEVDLVDYYTKTEVDAAIEQIELTPGAKGDKGEPGEPGKDYVLTEADKEEIAALVDVSGADVDLSDYYTKEEIDTLLSNLPTGGDIPSGEEVEF
jgi:hypothetical protein